jgi:hypothetical protein
LTTQAHSCRPCGRFAERREQRSPISAQAALF